jgi:hypothetical protein
MMLDIVVHHGHIYFLSDSHKIEHHKLNCLSSIGSMQALIHLALYGRCNKKYSYLLEASQRMVSKIQIPFNQQLILDGHFEICYKI